MKLLARSSLKKPFVKTVATVAMIGGAAAAGCSGSSADTIPTAKPTTPSSSCPTTMPIADSACDFHSSCTYCSGTSGTATCSNGKWEIGSASCNPPPPSLDCPSAMPAQGDACTGGGADSGTSNCGYQKGNCYSVASCQDGAWNVTALPCNPPAPQCPADKPQDGTPCSLPSGTRCNDPNYKDYCGNPVGPGDSTNPMNDPLQVTCEDGKWKVVELDYGPCGCPSEEPTQGGPCYSHLVHGSCEYKTDDAGCAADYATCEMGQWNITSNPCAN